MKYILFSFLVLTSCQPLPKHLYIHQDFLPYVKLFEIISIQQDRPIVIDNLILMYTDSYNNTNTLGNCYKSDIPLIKINQSSWYYLNDARREQLILHELGHCILGRWHLDGEVVDNGETIPQSIMDSIEFSDTIYERHLPYYYHELFHP